MGNAVPLVLFLMFENLPPGAACFAHARAGCRRTTRRNSRPALCASHTRGLAVAGPPAGTLARRCVLRTRAVRLSPDPPPELPPGAVCFAHARSVCRRTPRWNSRPALCASHTRGPSVAGTPAGTPARRCVLRTRAVRLSLDHHRKRGRCSISCKHDAASPSLSAPGWLVTRPRAVVYDQIVLS